MKKSLKPLAQAIVEHLHGKTRKEIDKEMELVIQYLSNKKLLGRIRDLEKEIGEAWKAKFGASKVTIVSAHPLTKKAKAELETFAAGAEIVERVDERLMGGAVIRADERRIDGSLIGSLQRLKNQLLKAE